jgi:hypothetical protein
MAIAVNEFINYFVNSHQKTTHFLFDIIGN